MNPKELEKYKANAISKPLVEHIYTADPSAHVFDGKIYIYPSHDIESDAGFDDDGGHFCMEDYHILSLDEVGGEVTDHGVALHTKDIPWAGRQLWAPDAAFKNGKYYLYFPLKDKSEIFKLGVAVSDTPQGPFKAEPEPIEGSYSIDPAVLEDNEDDFYIYFGGLWGGQLQNYRNNKAIPAVESPYGNQPAKDEPALCAKVAKLSNDMLQLAEEPRDVVILDEDGNPIKTGDEERRYFEGPWMHKYKGKYYFSYSTGNTHKLVYAMGDSPYGPFTYKGVILTPVVGWTTHHSICEFKGKWYLFYHDSTLSGGATHLRCVKMTELKYNEDGTIQTINPYGDDNIITDPE